MLEFTALRDGDALQKGELKQHSLGFLKHSTELASKGQSHLENILPLSLI